MKTYKTTYEMPSAIDESVVTEMVSRIDCTRIFGERYKSSSPTVDFKNVVLRITKVTNVGRILHIEFSFLDDEMIEKMRYEFFYNEGKIKLTPRLFGNLDKLNFLTCDLEYNR